MVLTSVQLFMLCERRFAADASIVPDLQLIGKAVRSLAQPRVLGELGTCDSEHLLANLGHYVRIQQSLLSKQMSARAVPPSMSTTAQRKAAS